MNHNAPNPTTPSHFVSVGDILPNVLRNIERRMAVVRQMERLAEIEREVFDGESAAS